jgi:S-DNA-T family DNA segregation ATPase FtsK/SpoIIIE
MPTKKLKPRPTKKKATLSKKKKVSSKRSLHPELIGLILLCFGLVSFLSLLSFTHHQPENNWLGAAGYGLALAYHALLGVGGFFAALTKINFGMRLICHKPWEHPKWQATYLTLFIVSTCALAALIAEEAPSYLTALQPHLYSFAELQDGPYPYLQVRIQAGGALMHFLYRDLPGGGLHAWLSASGVAIVFGTLFVVSGAFLIRKQLGTLMRKIATRFKAWRAARAQRKKQTPVAQTPSRTEPTIRSLALARLKAWLANTSTESSRDDPVMPRFEGKPRIIAPSMPKISASQEALGAPHEEEEQKLPIAKKRRSEKASEPTAAQRRSQALQQQRVYNGDFAEYALPKIDLLKAPKAISTSGVEKELMRLGQILEETLSSFGIEGKVGNIHCGPRIASFEVHPPVGVKVQKIKALENDIALNMQAKSTRIIAPIPGKAAVGIEIPNPKPHEVSFRELLELYKKSGAHHEIPVLLGKSTHGELITTDLARMPHGLIAGATGSGKSVCINTIILSILMTARPDEVKLLMVDPKKVELTGYSKLPHMIAPVITEPHGALSAVQWLVREMQTRYEILKKLGLRNILSFNSRAPDKEKEEALDIAVPDKMPYIVGIIDELADLMMAAGADIETPIARIAQMARAVGIHMILATQRPSREVITGLIKANFPTRISFKVASKINSSIILDETGAERLLGNGDMLFLPPGTSNLIRAQGAYVSDSEIQAIVDHICAQAPPRYLIESFDMPTFAALDDEAPKDSLFEQAREVVVETGNASTTFLQRKLKVGYARAASLMDELEERGIVSPAEGSKPRRVLVTSPDEE